MSECHETGVSQCGKNQSIQQTTCDTYAGELSSALKQTEDIIKGLSFLIEHIDCLGPNEEFQQQMDVILNAVEELDSRLSNIVEKTETSLSGED